jgi:hypothetical protein
MTTDFDYLEPIERAQLLHFRPDLRLALRLCKRCGGDLHQDSDVEYDLTFLTCYQCGAEHNENGELHPIPPYPNISKYKGGRRNETRKSY